MRRSPLLFSVRQYTPPFELPIYSQDRGTSRTAAFDEKKRKTPWEGGGGKRERGRERWREGGYLNKVLKITSWGREEKRDEEEKNERKYLLATTKTQEARTSVERELRWGTPAHDRALFSKTASAKAGFGCKTNVVDVHGEKQSKSEWGFAYCTAIQLAEAMRWWAFKRWWRWCVYDGSRPRTSKIFPGQVSNEFQVNKCLTSACMNVDADKEGDAC